MGHYDAGVRCTVIRDMAMDCCFYILLEYVGGHNMQMVVLFHTHTHTATRHRYSAQCVAPPHAILDRESIR